jgi:hypothetical protein
VAQLVDVVGALFDLSQDDDGCFLHGILALGGTQFLK